MISNRQRAKLNAERRKMPLPTTSTLKRQAEVSKQVMAVVKEEQSKREHDSHST